MRRRHFLRSLALTGMSLPFSRSFAFEGSDDVSKKSLSIGWITDVHHGYCTDADKRLEAFINAAITKNPDFILQGGDFCHPTPEAASFLNIWNKFKGPKYHVLGNHDMDKGTKQQIMDLWQMEKPYYSFDKGAFHFVVMDCNHILSDGKYIDYVKGNFYIDSNKRDLVNPEQIEWLKEDLARTTKPTIIISHQSFDDVWTGYTVPNKFAVRKVIDDANGSQKKPKVIACFCGHHHLDNHMMINGVHYIHINSASYYYVGDGFGSDGAKAMYADPLYCFVTLNPRGKITIEGRQSHFLSPTPTDKGYVSADKITAVISGRELSYTF